MNAPARTLQSAEDRREAVVAAAVKVFAERGFQGTPTLEVAKAAGISHAYLFRLFPTKTDLAVAVVDRVHERIAEVFGTAAAGARATGDDPLQAMGHAYAGLLAERDLLLLQLHIHAASPHDEAIRAAARRGFERLVELVERESGADAESVGRFFSIGMLMNVMAALDAGSLGAHWTRVLAEYCMKDRD
jgi:AcrR family transcriptional regulator